MIRTAAWTVPAVSLVSAAPAFANSPNSQWAVASQSFEGTTWDDRNNGSIYQMRFTMTVPAGVTVVAPQVFVQLTGGRGGNTWHEDDDIWSLTRTDGNAGALSVWWNQFFFTRPDIVGPSVASLWFNLTTMTQGGTASRGTITVSSGNAATGPTAVFDLLRQNAGPAPGYITSPPV